MGGLSRLDLFAATHLMKSTKPLVIMKTLLYTPESVQSGGRYADDNIIHSFKGRAIDFSKEVLVYKNLHNGMYSIKQSGLVVAHAERLCLVDVKFVVNRSGRDRVLKEKKKNVHAFIKGRVSGSCMGTTAIRNDLPMEVTYDPYKYNRFMCTNITKSAFPLKGARAAIIDGLGVRASYGY